MKRSNQKTPERPPRSDVNAPFKPVVKRSRPAIVYDEERRPPTPVPPRDEVEDLLSSDHEAESLRARLARSKRRRREGDEQRSSDGFPLVRSAGITPEKKKHGSPRPPVRRAIVIRDDGSDTSSDDDSDQATQEYVPATQPMPEAEEQEGPIDEESEELEARQVEETNALVSEVRSWPVATSEYRSRSFVFTLHCVKFAEPQYDDTLTASQRIQQQKIFARIFVDRICSDTKPTYCINGYERAPSTDNYHLQGFIMFKTAKTFDAVNTIFQKKAWLQRALVPLKAIEYCKKDGDFIEYGVAPTTLTGAEGNGKREKAKWDQTKELAKKGEFDSINSQHLVCYYSSLRSIHRDFQQIPGELDDVAGYWFYGAPGAGKSHDARALAQVIAPGEEPYLKNFNKWFDQYQGQAVVIVDEASPAVAALVQYVKKWCDKYPCQVEIKGSSITIRPRAVIFTSNYSIEECFQKAGTKADLKAVKRRMKEIRYYPDEWNGEGPAVYYDKTTTEVIVANVSSVEHFVQPVLEL